MSVLLTQCTGNKAQVIIRSLGKQKIEITSADSKTFSPGFFSKYSKYKLVTPIPTQKPLEYIQFLKNYLKRNKIEVVLPINSYETLLISKYKDNLGNLSQIPISDYNIMHTLNDKQILAEIASNLDLPIPKTYNYEDYKNLKNFAKSINYPVVIKPREGRSSQGVYYAYSENNFLSIMQPLLLKNDSLKQFATPIVQDFVDGVGYGVSALLNEGDIRASFTHKRIREFPLSGGPSTLRVSTHHSKMEKIARDLLESVDWHGVAMVEFKLEKDTGKPYIIEVNPRFWGSINLAIQSGVNFPYLLYQLAVDGDINPVLSYKTGVESRFLLNDIRALLALFGANRDVPSFIKELFRFNNIDEFDMDDPLPFVPYLLNKLIYNDD
ncbi:MAG: ATP-grasp domain-containing protein [Candidatus Thermoplasmatota archaeon]|nr:ATP-grasp domain-containing protein [Candidatus Thermoplasmatota archaeon]